MIFKIFLLIVSATAVLSRPQGQLLTFQDGKFGVNFGGYHAEAGLGGLLTGNAAHGGLSASAGTPFGQQAGAGLGGGVDGQGKSSGGAYAGASAGYGVGASAALGGGIGGEGGSGGVGAESHVPGKVTKVVKLAQLNPSASFDATKEINEVPSSNIATRFNVEESDSTQKEVQVQTVAVAQAPVSTPVIVKTVHKKKFHHHQPAVVYEKRISYEPAQVQVHQQVEHKQIPQQTYTNTAQNTNLDYRKFFDFGFFSNIAAGFGGPHATYSQQQQPQQVVYEKTYTPITYEKRVVHQKQVPTYVEKEVEVVKRVDADVDSQVVVHKQIPQVHKTVTYSGSTGSNFFNDIFNIPISALTSVNRFLNNNVGNVHYQKTVGVY